MAYITPDEEIKRKKEEEERSVLTEGGQAPLQGGTSAGGLVGGAVPEQQSRPSFQQILDVNRPQSAELAGRVAGLQRQKSSSIFDPALQSEEEQFRQAATMGSRDLNRALLDKALTSPGSLTDAERTEFTQMRDAMYGGPESFAGTGAEGRLANIRGDVGRIYKQDEDVGGLQQMLTQLGAGGGRGKMAFNTGLLMSDPESRALLTREEESGMSELDRRLAEAGKGAQTFAGQRRAATEATRGAVGTEMGEAIEGAYGSAQQNLQNVRRQQQQRQATIRNALVTGQLDDATIASMGMNRDQWTRLHGAAARIRQGFGATTNPYYEAKYKVLSSPEKVPGSRPGWWDYNPGQIIGDLGNPAQAWKYKPGHFTGHMKNWAQQKWREAGGQNVEQDTRAKPGFDLNQYLNFQGAPSLEATMTPQQQAKLNALTNLMGQRSRLTPGVAAGTYNVGQEGFRGDQALQGLEAMIRQYEQTYAPQLAWEAEKRRQVETAQRAMGY